MSTKMKFVSVFVRLIFALISTLPFCLGGNRFVCYFPNWARYRTGSGQFTVASINPSLCTHYMYAFAVLDANTYNINVVDPWGDISLNGYSNFVALKSKNPNLKVMISLGGWNDSNDGTGKYSKLVASSTNIAAFVNYAMAFLAKYSFDGLDIDWENPSTAADKAGYSNLITALRTAFNTKGYLLSAAVSCNPTAIDAGYNAVIMSQKVDFINLMTYDMHGSSWERTVADHLAPLYKRSWDTVNLNVNYSVNYWISKGFPAAKINMGIPLYGQSWTIKSATSAVPPAPANGAGLVGTYTGQPGVLGYQEICLNVKNNGWKVVQDPLGKMGPYAYSNANLNWVGYDDPAFAIVKSKYLVSMGLGGAMVWDISTDDFGNLCGGGANPIITAISQAIGIINQPSTTSVGPKTSSATTKPNPTISTLKPASTVTATSTKGTSTKTSKPITTPATTSTTSKPNSSTTSKASTISRTTIKTTTKYGAFVCPKPNGLFPNPTSCTTYYSCGNGIAYLMNCPTGLYFNPATSNCDWPANVKCTISG